MQCAWKRAEYVCLPLGRHPGHVAQGLVCIFVVINLVTRQHTSAIGHLPGSAVELCGGDVPGSVLARVSYVPFSQQACKAGCPTFWHLRATLEEKGLFWATQ